MSRIIGFSARPDGESQGRVEVPKSLMVRTEDIVNGNLWRSLPAINCDRMADIPSDYPGPIGVPISIMDKLNREQFDIVCMLTHGSLGADRPDLYRRVIIRHLHPKCPEEIDLVQLFGSFGIPIDVEYIPVDEPPQEMIPAHRRCECIDPAMVDGRKIARERMKK